MMTGCLFFRTKGVDADTSLNVTLLGERFTLSCKSEDRDALEAAVATVRELLAKMLAANPALTAQQAALLVAVRAVSQSAERREEVSDFEKALTSRVERLEKLLRQR